AFGAIHKGGTVVLQGNPEKLDPEDVWGTAERERVSTIAIVGDAFARPLLDGLDQRQYDLSRLFIVGSGGALLSPHNKQAFLERGSVSINTGGEKVYAEEVEQVLRRHPAVYDAVVVGTPDERFGERVTALVQPRSGARPSAEELVAFAAQHLARYKLPKTTV